MNTEKEKGNLASLEPEGASDDNNESIVESGKSEISTLKPIEAETSGEEKAKTLKKSRVAIEIKPLLVRTKNYLSEVLKIFSNDEIIDFDLAPTDKADKNGVYSKALQKAIRNKNVTNIALTGPYGSGKSSIIRTFVKKYKNQLFPWPTNKRILNISLAAFLTSAEDNKSSDKDPPPESGKIPENEGQKDKNPNRDLKQEIERSILQQMIYKVEAKHLPLSRFKRIPSPNSWRPVFSFFILIGALSCWYLLNQRTKILTGEFFIQFDFSNRVFWLNFSCLAAGLLLVGSLIHRIYMMSFGLSIKGISLKEVAITPHAIDKESILNRHLDEIVYFFQATKYDLVVIEDLDRFDNPDIFVTLREINGLINANSGIKRKVCFLYALRDDMFANTDRTKFFESIIPVIPIINTTNSIDKVLEQVKRLDLKSRLDERFLREVSRYLNDYRLIINIFKEYEIYIKNLDGNNENTLDANKLLAVLIYKNILPSDFENLHREKGGLARIFEKYEEFVARTEAKYKNEISEIEHYIEESEKQLPSTLSELRSIYAMAVLNLVPAGYIYFDFNGNSNVSLNSLASFLEFDSLVEGNQLFVSTPNSGQKRVDIGNVQTMVSPNKSYQQRKAEVENKSADFKEKSNLNIETLRRKISTLRLLKLNEVLRLNLNEAEIMFDEFGENKDLMKFLVLEGHLNESYFDYTSLFHSDSGRLSSNDNKFLKKIRSYNNPEPNFKIDNPKVVINEMRGSDFSQNFALNKTLVDYMFGSQIENHEKIDNLLAFVSSNFEECEAFFEVYYKNGKFVSEFLAALIDKWEGFVSAAIGSSTSTTHVGRMLAHLPEKYLEDFQINNPDLIEFISHRLSEVLALKIDFEPARLKCLKFEIEDLASIESYPAELRLLFDEGFYKISAKNIDFVFRNFLSSTDIAGLETRHYSTVIATENAALISKVESDFEHYLSNVLLQLENNSEEDVSTILKVINHEEIDLEKLKEFLDKQSARLPLLNEAPSRLYTTLLQSNKIKPTWENCLTFINDENFDQKILTIYLQEATTIDSLRNVTISKNDDERSLQNFVLNNNDFSEDIYRTYVQCIPEPFEVFPEELTEEKLKILIEEQKIEFSGHNFSFLASSQPLQVQFVALNILAYFEIADEVTLDDDFRHELLSTSISDEQKLKIIELMDLTILNSLPSRAALIGAILERTRVDIANIDATAAMPIIISSNPIETKISLFNKLQRILDNDQVREVILNLPNPFCQITRGWHKPRIEASEQNIELAKWLKERKFISSWKKVSYLWSLDEIAINLFRS